MLESRVAEFCERAIAFRGDRTKSVHWSNELKLEALRLIDQGVDLELLASQSKISKDSIKYWLESRGKKQKARFSEIKVKSVPPVAQVAMIEVVAISQRHRIEIKGLKVEDLKSLLRERLL